MPDIITASWITTGIIYTIDTLIKIWLLVHVPKRRKPTAATAWLLLIFMIPFIGFVIFFILGNTKLSRDRRAKQGHITKALASYSEELARQNVTQAITGEGANTASLATKLTGLMPTKGNAVKLLTDYNATIEDMVRSINKAEKYVYVAFYILALDNTTERFITSLEAAQARGVEVYVLFDAWGSRKFPNYKLMQERLTIAGVKWRKMLPFTISPRYYNRPDLRNHRKIVVTDNTHAYIGSLNMIDSRYNRKDTIEYIELVSRISGPAVGMMASVFASDWYSETNEVIAHFIENKTSTSDGNSVVQVVPSGPGYSYQNNLKTFVSLIYEAKKSIIITNPYLVPDETLLSALIGAAARGVRVSILNSEAMDQWLVGHAQRSYYSELLEAGVEIHLYRKPKLVHEKHLAIDSEIAVIGSSNLDIRSFELNLECSVLAYDPIVAGKLVHRHEELLKHSRTIKLHTWRQRSGWVNFLDSIARLTSALQ